MIDPDDDRTLPLDLCDDRDELVDLGREFAEGLATDLQRGADAILDATEDPIETVTLHTPGAIARVR